MASYSIRSSTIRLGIFISTLVIAAILVFQLVWLNKVYHFEQKEFDHSVVKAIRGLYEDIDVENYIKETKNAISMTRNKYYKLHFSLNLAIGYDALGEYQEAIANMRNLDISGARLIYKALYYNNLAFFYYEAGNSQAAIQTYSDGEKFINKLLEHPIYRGAPLHTKGIIEYINGNFISSEELLEKSKLQINSNNHLVTSANLYIAKICLQTNRTPKAKVLLDYNLSQKLLPNIFAETKKVVEEMKCMNYEV